MSMVGIAYQNNHDLDQPDIVNLLVIGFSGTLHEWWDTYLTDESKDSIKHAVKKNDEGLPIFDENIGRRILDGVMFRKDCHKPYWKERFIDGLPPIFAYKVKQVLMGKNDSIDYDHLTYGDIFSAINLVLICVMMKNY